MQDFYMIIFKIADESRIYLIFIDKCCINVTQILFKLNYTINLNILKAF